MVRPRSLPVALALLTIAGAAFADDGWKLYAVRGEVRLEQRAVAGSSYYEYRAQATLPVPPAQVLDTIWFDITHATPKSVKKRTVVRAGAGELVVYDRIHAPVVSDRDAVIRIWKVPGAGGGGEIRFHSVGEGPAPAQGYVRIPIVRGAWQATPDGGGTRLTYLCYSEPGGSVPAFLVRGVQRDEVVSNFQRMLARIRGQLH